ncbi:hypothetical protein Taro_045959 [Colocasia esculenta]|uniref:Uncharacterized protein n=1 Tax=Colocasia esculenta TaxID=4460 RepID=A0A843WY86_COLES|nr:hypothetical protein [Colocasia esculenta]
MWWRHSFLTRALPLVVAYERSSAKDICGVVGGGLAVRSGGVAGGADRFSSADGGVSSAGASFRISANWASKSARAAGLDVEGEGAGLQAGAAAFRAWGARAVRVPHADGVRSVGTLAARCSSCSSDSFSR